MALNLTLGFGNPSSGTPFPGTVKALGDLIAQYLLINGGADFIALNFGPDTPGVDDRDKPWFKTTEPGVPIGWYSWNGTAWAQMPTTIKSGTTASRPTADEGTLYFDTDIDVLLIFERGAWRTVSGSPGDVKFVRRATLAEALTANPGWIEDEYARGRVIGAAGTGTGLTPRNYEDLVGTEEHALVIGEIPEHDHSLPWAAFSGQHQNGTQAAGIYPIVTNAGSTDVADEPATGTGGLAHNNMQPTTFYWCLIKA